MISGVPRTALPALDDLFYVPESGQTKKKLDGDRQRRPIYPSYLHPEPSLDHQHVAYSISGGVLDSSTLPRAVRKAKAPFNTQHQGTRNNNTNNTHTLAHTVFALATPNPSLLPAMADTIPFPPNINGGENVEARKQLRRRRHIFPVVIDVIRAEAGRVGREQQYPSSD